MYNVHVTNQNKSSTDGGNPTKKKSFLGDQSL